MWTFDQARTKARYETLQAYYRDHGLNADTFACPNFAICANSVNAGFGRQYAGGTAGLMPFYDTNFDGIDIRVLVIGKERAYSPDLPYGTAPNFEAQSLECLQPIRYPNTIHIKRTLTMLQNIFGTTSRYVYASYALSNGFRCAYQKLEYLKSTSGLPTTSTMQFNCFPYLVDEIRILEPTLVIAQGEWAIKKPTLLGVLTNAFGQAKCHRKNASGRYNLYEFPGFMYLSTHHPSYQFWDVVSEDSLWPMLDHLRELGHLPTIPPDAGNLYEPLVKPTIMSLLDKG
jgi:uracil-DNA glycosylase